MEAVREASRGANQSAELIPKSVFGRGEIREMVNDGENHFVNFGRGQSGDKVQGYVRPQPRRHGKKTEQPGRTLMGSLVLGTNLTGGDELTSVPFQRRPPVCCLRRLTV